MTQHPVLVPFIEPTFLWPSKPISFGLRFSKWLQRLKLILFFSLVLHHLELKFLSEPTAVDITTVVDLPEVLVDLLHDVHVINVATHLFKLLALFFLSLLLFYLKRER